eukprot:6240244-Pyramimonas_sp.AAC.1
MLTESDSDSDPQRRLLSPVLTLRTFRSAAGAGGPLRLQPVTEGARAAGASIIKCGQVTSKCCQ